MPEHLDVAIVFAKYPEPGRVKTRLIGALTAEQAADVHRRLLRATLQCLDGIAGLAVVLAVSPDEADFAEFAGTPIATWPQGGGDLGSRLALAVERAFGMGSQRVLLVGSDCPQMSPEDAVTALDLLHRHDVVMGPAMDGGYYLLGLCRPVTELFASIDWSSPRVSVQTQARASEAGLSLAMLQTRRDVDEVGDIMAIVDEIADDDPRLGSLKAYLRSLLSARRST